MSGVKQTFTGNRALVLEEALIFEIGVTSKCGVDLEPVPETPSMLGDCGAKQAVNLPGLSELIVLLAASASDIRLRIYLAAIFQHFVVHMRTR